MRRYATIFTVIFFLPSWGTAATIHVPEDHATIQAAIDAAGYGDTVLVAPGTYLENVIFKGKVITVKSSQGPHHTVIDGNQFTHVVMFNQNEGPDTVLEGFTLTNGSHSKGAGVYCKDSASPSIIGNVITGNEAGEGGGIFCIHADPVILGNIFSLNSATSGGGIYCDNAEPAILNNLLFENATTASGGGIFCFSCSPEMVNNTFVGNSAASGRGGAIAGNNFQSVIVNSILWGNSAPDGPEIGLGSYDNPAVSYCDVKGGWVGTGNIDSDPLFVDEANGDFHLTFGSPCRGSGDNTVVTELYDFEGDPRIYQGTVDMGADEFHTHLYFTGNATPGGSVELKFVGLPGASPLGFWIAANVLDTPIPGAYGDWWLLLPTVGPFILPPIPASGAYVLPGTIPPSPAGPYTLYLQAIMGTPLTLTNLLGMDVQ